MIKNEFFASLEKNLVRHTKEHAEQWIISTIHARRFDHKRDTVPLSKIKNDWVNWYDIHVNGEREKS